MAKSERYSEEDETAIPLLGASHDVEFDSHGEIPSGPDAETSADGGLYPRHNHSSLSPDPAHWHGRKEGIAGGSGGKGFVKRTPLPLLQLFMLCVCRLSEPIAYTQIFPYVNKMVEDMKVTDKKAEIGYYSGIIDSIFAVAQLFTVLQWGKLSDRIGRKPVILIGLLGVALSSTLFGFAKSFWPAVIARSLAGGLSGNSAVSQSVVGEITDETNQAQAFPLTGLSWSLGCIIGPMIGGNFAVPAYSLPNTFGRVQIFRDHPYLLPCVISSSITVITVIVGLIFLKETLPSKVRLDTSLPSPITSRLAEKQSKHSSDFLVEKKEEIGVKTILSSKAIRSIYKNYFLLSVCGTSFDVVFTLLAYTPVHLGGLSRTPDEIGYALAFSGAAGAFVQVFVFPILQRRYDSIPLYRILMLIWPILFAILPMLSVIARWTAPGEAFPVSGVPAIHGGDMGSVGVDIGVDVDGGGGGEEEMMTTTYPAGPLLWLGIAIALALLRCGHMCYSLNVILIKNAAPSKEALGATFGLAQTVACVARAGSPAFVSSFFAMSIKYRILGGNLVWVLMILIGLFGWWSTLSIKDRDTEVGINDSVYGGHGRSSSMGSEECEMDELRTRG